MAYNAKSIIKDVNGKPVPQYFNVDTDKFEVITSKGGMLRTILIDNKGNEILSQNLVNQVSAKIDELIKAVNKGGL